MCIPLHGKFNNNNDNNEGISEVLDTKNNIASCLPGPTGVCIPVHGKFHNDNSCLVTPWPYWSAHT